jgi:hypothetical protein
MISFEQARAIAVADMGNSDRQFDDLGGLVLLDIYEETPFAWIFFYNTRSYLETGNMYHALGGNSPYFISKKDGNIQRFSTAHSTEHNKELYEEKYECWRLEIVPDIEMDARKLLQLKSILGLSHAGLKTLMSSPPVVIAKGAKKRLCELEQQLSGKGIDTIISLNFHIS